MLYKNLTVGKNGNLCFAGQDTVALAKQYGTPLYLMDEDNIRNRIRVYKNTMAGYHHLHVYGAPEWADNFCNLARIWKENGVKQ